MLSSSNRKEQFRKQEPKKQRFAIKKLTVGVASVLIGFTFMGVNAYAADNSNSENNNESHTPAITGKTNSESGDPNESSHSLVLTNSLQKSDEGNTSTASSSDVSSNNEAAPSSETVAPLLENKEQTNATNVREVNNYADFLTALGDKSIDTITLTRNIDGSAGNGGYDTIGDTGVAHTVTINGQGQYGLNMGSRYIYLKEITETNNDHWNITFEDLKDIQTQNSSYGLLCIFAKDASKDSINFRNVNVNANTTALTGKNESHGAVNVTFSGNNTIKGTLTESNALVAARNLEIKNGTTTVTPTANNAKQAAAFSVAGNATVDSDAKLVITSTAKNVGGLTFSGNAGSQKIDNATAGVLRLMPNAQVTMDLGAGKSMAVYDASDIDLQNGSVLSVTSAMLTTGGRADAPITLNATNNVRESTFKIANDAKLTIHRNVTGTSDSALISFGRTNVVTDTCDGKSYYLIVDGGSLDLVDYANNSDLWPKNVKAKSTYRHGWPGIISMWGTSSHDHIQFTNPKFVNIARPNATAKGSFLIHLDSAGARDSWLKINSADSEYITPFVVRILDMNEPTIWNIKYLSNVSQGGDYAYSFQKGSGDYYGYGSEYMNHAENNSKRGNNEVIVYTEPSDTGYTHFSGGQYIDENG